MWSLISGGQALGTNRSPPRNGASQSRLDGAISLKEVRMSSDPREATALFRYRIVVEATPATHTRLNVAGWFAS